MDELKSSFEARIRSVRVKEQTELQRVRLEADTEIRKLVIEALQMGVSLGGTQNLLAISASSDKGKVKQVEGDTMSPAAGKNTSSAIGISSVSVPLEFEYIF
jgi:hypothetical protein